MFLFSHMPCLVGLVGLGLNYSPFLRPPDFHLRSFLSQEPVPKSTASPKPSWTPITERLSSSSMFLTTGTQLRFNICLGIRESLSAGVDPLVNSEGPWCLVGTVEGTA